MDPERPGQPPVWLLHVYAPELLHRDYSLDDLMISV